MNMVIFHGYVSLPEGMGNRVKPTHTDGENDDK